MGVKKFSLSKIVISKFSIINFVKNEGIKMI